MCPWYPSEIIKTIVWLNKRHFHLRGVWIQSTQNMINVCLHFVALHGKDEMSVHTEMQINILLLPNWNVALKVSSDSRFHVLSQRVNVVLSAVCSCTDPLLHSLCMLTSPPSHSAPSLCHGCLLLHASTSHPDPAPPSHHLLDTSHPWYVHTYFFFLKMDHCRYDCCCRCMTF